MKTKHVTKIASLVSLLMGTTYAFNTNAAIPTGYYDSVDNSSQQALHASLHQIIDDHQRFPYTSSSTDTWDILESADQDPTDSNAVITLYRNAKYSKQGGGNSFYNREHSWPKSYGFPNDGSSNSAYTDAHHLFIADSGYNSSRSNKPFNICTSGCSAKSTEANNGRGGTSAEQNYTAGSFTNGVWETWSGRRGDVARALMYLAVRYEGGTHGVTGYSEPDLILTDNLSLIESSNQGSNLSVAYMGLRSVLIQWHKEDPVDDIERRRNDVIYSYQGNRNPFIDHPEYVDCVFTGVCNGSGGSDTTPPSVPTGLTGQGGSSVSLTWSTNSEADLAGYYVYRSEAGGSYTRITGSSIATPSYTDSAVAGETTYRYLVTAVDFSGNESGQSNSVSVTTDPITLPSNNVWINEFHYDNSSTDTGEFVEIAGAAGENLSGWSVIGYNGSNGEAYKTVTLSGVIPNESNGFGTLGFSFSSMQNGSPDGLALVNSLGELVQLISYEGSFTATNGIASGALSENIGVSETSSTPVGYSLQLSGTGSQYADFTWRAASQNTQGAINTNQAFAGSSNTPPSVEFTFLCTYLDCTYDASASTDSDGSIISYAWNFGDSSTSNAVSGSHNFASAGEFTVTLTVTDNQGASSSSSQTILVEAPPAQGTAWINEFHYDNSGGDTGEFVEIAGNAGLSLDGWKVYGYNGSNGSVYKTISLSGVIPNQSNGFGTLSFNFSAMQNGSPDGLALVDDKGEIQLFISYEGTLTATSGIAAGQTSVNIGVSETSSTKVGYSLQLTGSGSRYEDFTWATASRNTSGNVNKQQTFK